MVKKVILIKPRGFCAGVSRAIDIVDKALKLYEKPIYIKHQIVHNKHITSNFEDKGAITVESIDDIPENSIAIFSAHGSPIEDFKKADKKGIKVIDAVCPLVKKVHFKVQNYLKNGHKIIYIGNENHIEAKSIIAYSPEDISIISCVEDIKHLDFNSCVKLACLTQTTLNVHKTQDILVELKKKFPNIELENKYDICYATTNRQEAVMNIAKKVDLMIIVGSCNSSNTTKLFNISKKYCKFAYMIDDVLEIKYDWFYSVEMVGISSGASVPDYLIKKIIDYFENLNIKINETIVSCENTKFILPKELL